MIKHIKTLFAIFFLEHSIFIQKEVQKIKKGFKVDFTKKRNRVFYTIYLIIMSILSYLLIWSTYESIFFRFLTIFMSSYITLLSLYQLLSFFNKYKFFRFLLLFISLPLSVLILISNFIDVLLNIIVIFIIIIIANALFFMFIFDVVLSTSTHTNGIVFLTLTNSAILLTIFGDKILLFYSKYVIKENPSIIKINNIFNQKKIRVFLFLIYFFVLLISNFITLSKYGSYNFNQLMLPILSSFAVFVAFDRVVTNWSVFLPQKSKDVVQKKEESI